MKEAVEVSVIVLACNQAELIGEALDSIIRQRCDFSYEIVVSDDCSTDGTRRVAEEYARRYPDLIRLLPPSESRRGLVKNYFYTLGECHGRFIADCAADDHWLTDMGLQRKYDLLAGDDSLSMACSDWATFDGTSPQKLIPAASLNESGKVAVVDGRRLMEHELAFREGAVVHLSTVLYRRDILEKALRENHDMVFNESFGCEDLPVKLALMARGSVTWIPEITLAYRVGGGSLSAPGNAADAVRFQIETSEAIGTLADFYGIERKAVMPNLFGKLRYAISVAFKASEWDLVSRAWSVSRRFGVSMPVRHKVMAIVARCLSHGKSRHDKN